MVIKMLAKLTRIDLQEFCNNFNKEREKKKLSIKQKS